MTNTASRRRQKHKHVTPKIKPKAVTSDRAVYIGILVIGVFAVILANLFSEVRYPAVFVLIYIAIIAYLVNFYTFQVYRGRHLLNWQQALVRIPLRFVGYGTKEGKPLEAAHGHPETRTALIASIVVSLLLLAIGAFAVYRWPL